MTPAERTLGNYVLGPMLGRGGMSEVHAARHRFLGDRVAIKLLHAHLAGDAQAIAGFIAEATRTRAIAHPNVVRVIDFGSDGDDCYLVMELVEGESLAARLERTPRLDEASVRSLGAAIADGLAAAHDRGIVHRDLKPGNIMLADDTPKIVDFGIARTFGSTATTMTGSRVGTLAYMAPEQITGGLIAPCIDVWALGVILFEAIAGRLPFADFGNGRTPQLFEPPPRLAGLAVVSPALEALVAACLARDPGRRPPSMRAIADELRRPAPDLRITEDLAPSLGPAPQAVAADVLGAHTGPRKVAAGDERARPRARAVAVAIAVAAAIAIAAGWALHTRDPRAEEPGLAARGMPSPDAPPLAARSTAEDEAGAGSSPGAVRSTTGARPRAAAAPKGGAVRSTSPPPTEGKAAAGGSPAASFTVEVRSAPAGAGVIVDGKRVGITPATIALDAPASILVTRAGYRTSRVRVERAGPIDVRLVPARHPRSSRGPAAGETLD